MEGDAEIVVCRRVVLIDQECVLVVRDRLVDIAVFEEQITDRRDRRG